MTSKHEIIGRGTTFDGYRVELGADGVIYVPNRGKRSVGVEAGLLVLGDVCVYAVDEVLRLAECARRGKRQNWVHPREYMRRSFAGDRLVTHCNAMGSVGAVSWKAAL